ncbi:surfeit locus protein 6-domain-containing protein [Exophiala viscosa]|uniref:surfeit locus protein 6-domain-containing protein n=1 Tax=Exophiala viscosa TaxID=2486360 RepID=UPI002190C9CD|nr:surfeit locus protein 6-domain-containing protein [Exophiala viscosa]
MPDELEERLKSHARAFDSLLSLIPAKLYYGEDVSDQWQRKKQTPEQKRAAKMAKLDPDNWKSAKDVMDERAALKRKRESDNEEDEADPSILEKPGMEQPKAAPTAQAAKVKKQKIETKATTQPDSEEKETEEDIRRRKALQRAEKRALKSELKAQAKEKKERQKAKKNGTEQDGQSIPREVQLKEPIDLKSQPLVNDDQASTASSEEELPEIFSPPHESTTSSTSSILPSTLDEPIKPQLSNLQIPSAPSDETSSKNTSASGTPRERLQEAIQRLRAERKADKDDARGPKNRQELLEQRRKKEEERKAAKKEQKRREKEEEARRQDEEIARRFSPGGSGSLLASPRSPQVGDNGPSTNFSFGRIAFDDGTQFDPSSSTVVEDHKKKGPRDTASELKAAMAKKQRLAGLDEDKRKEIAEKDMWLNAKKRAHGEHVRDDTSLLKKALKRQQGQKKKSEKEWTERLEGVQKAQYAKQKKRVDNLAKRKDEKGSHGKSKKRPGFEGSFKGRTGGKKK